MNVPSNFTFFGKTKPLPVGDYQGKIISFDFKDMVSKKSNKPYVALSAKVEVNGETRYVNLSLDPAEKGKATHNLILQMAEQTGKTEAELVEMCSVPQDFFNLAIGKTIKLTSTPKGYLDVWSREEVEQTVNPKDIPF